MSDGKSTLERLPKVTGIEDESGVRPPTAGVPAQTARPREDYGDFGHAAEVVDREKTPHPAALAAAADSATQPPQKRRILSLKRFVSQQPPQQPPLPKRPPIGPYVEAFLGSVGMNTRAPMLANDLFTAVQALGSDAQADDDEDAPISADDEDGDSSQASSGDDSIVTSDDDPTPESSEGNHVDVFTEPSDEESGEDEEGEDADDDENHESARPQLAQGFVPPEFPDESSVSQSDEEDGAAEQQQKKLTPAQSVGGEYPESVAYEPEHVVVDDSQSAAEDSEIGGPGRPIFVDSASENGDD